MRGCDLNSLTINPWTHLRLFQRKHQIRFSTLSQVIFLSVFTKFTKCQFSKSAEFCAMSEPSQRVSETPWVLRSTLQTSECHFFHSLFTWSIRTVSWFVWPISFIHSFDDSLTQQSSTATSTKATNSNYSTKHWQTPLYSAFLRCLHTQGWAQGQVEIVFYPFKYGNLCSIKDHSLFP